jgi:3-oxoacyl-[acyl-carrier protein] reductase
MAGLRGRRAIVAGAGSKHGAAAVRALAMQGAEIFAVDRDASASQDLSPGASVLTCDMSETAVADVIATIERAGRPLDIVVTCPPAIAETAAPTVADLRQAFRLLTEPAMIWTAAAAKVMAPRRTGTIVHVTGLSGLGAWRGRTADGAAFAAVQSLVRSLAVELAPSEVRVNALVAGIDATEARAIAATAGCPERDVRGRIPLGLTMPETALANALLYLVHPSSTYVSGQALAVDGGWSTWGRLHAVAS